MTTISCLFSREQFTITHVWKVNSQRHGAMPQHINQMHSDTRTEYQRIHAITSTNSLSMANKIINPREEKKIACAVYFQWHVTKKSNRKNSMNVHKYNRSYLFGTSVKTRRLACIFGMRIVRCCSCCFCCRRRRWTMKKKLCEINKQNHYFWLIFLDGSDRSNIAKWNP